MPVSNNFTSQVLRVDLGMGELNIEQKKDNCGVYTLNSVSLLVDKSPQTQEIKLQRRSLSGAFFIR